MARTRKILIRQFMHVTIVHWHGKSWQQMRIPVRWHRCHVDTEGVMSWALDGYSLLVQRCRCGGYRSVPLFDAERRRGRWKGRNTRRTNNVFMYLPTI